MSASQDEVQAKISELKRHLGVSSTRGLAQKLGVSPMAVSRWESGTYPDVSGFIKLAKAAPESSRWFFFERAGLTREDFVAAIADSGPAGLGAPGALDAELLIGVIEAVREELKKRRRKLPSRKFAELVTLFYEHFQRTGVRDLDMVEKVIMIA